MSYTVTVSGTTFTVGMSSVDYAVTLSQVGQQGAAGPTGISWLGAWALSTDFALRDVVSNNGSSHICIQAHTSSATDEPGVGANAATYWEVLAAKGVDGSGTGTVTSIDVAGGTGLTSSGGPITSSGTITVALDAASQASLALADSALQSSDIGVSVQGYSAILAATTASFTTADETKLDGIETGATADQTGAEIKTAYEGEPDTNAYTDAEKSKLAGIEAGADVTDAINVAAAGALMDSEVANLAEVKAFDPADYATAAQGALADSALQSGDNISVLTNNTGYITDVTGDNLSALADVTITTIASGELLKWNGSAWINNTIAEAGLATAAQGALADSAAQEADVETTTINAQTGTTYTLALADRGQTVTMDNASANTVTIPTNASVAFAVGSVVTVIQKGAGVTTIAGATGVTVNGVSAGSGDMSAQWQGVAVMKIATDEWIVSGAIGTVA